MTPKHFFMLTSICPILKSLVSPVHVSLSLQRNLPWLKTCSLSLIPDEGDWPTHISFSSLLYEKVFDPDCSIESIDWQANPRGRIGKICPVKPLCQLPGTLRIKPVSVMMLLAINRRFARAWASWKIRGRGQPFRESGSLLRSGRTLTRV